MKLWQQNNELDKKIENFVTGDDYLLDQKLVKYDCLASISHAVMLNKIGILTKKERDGIINNLDKIIDLDEKGKFKIKKEEEDCHTSIENYLVKKLGDTGKKIHTARSRNDQVLTALRLYCIDEINDVTESVDLTIKKLEFFIEKYGDIGMPGYTHTRKAMPSSICLWAESFIESMEDNKKLMHEIKRLVNQSPLGTGAGYGLPIQIDRKLTSDILDFAKVQNNPIYVQNSRGKFESSILHGLNQVMLDLNKMSSDIIFFSIPEIGYFELSDKVCTGSSIMPHKKNPDALELVRAKYHETLAYEFEVKSMIGNLISGYNRDLQLIKEPVMKGFEITKDCLEVMQVIFDEIKVNKDKCEKAMTPEIYATEKAYELVKEGTPFREAYRKIAKEFRK